VFQGHFLLYIIAAENRFQVPPGPLALYPPLQSVLDQQKLKFDVIGLFQNGFNVWGGLHHGDDAAHVVQLLHNVVYPLDHIAVLVLRGLYLHESEIFDGFVEFFFEGVLLVHFGGELLDDLPVVLDARVFQDLI